jgi:hypothetical protein
MRKTLPFLLTALLTAGLCFGQQVKLGSHEAKYAADGSLVPWTAWSDALDREMTWYFHCPTEHGYPRFISTTFMDGKYEALPKRPDSIPAMQNGMGIISYLKYYHYKHNSDQRILDVARAMGDYLVKESLTPDTGKYPRFTRSTGWRDKFPQPPDSGSQDDKPYEVQPDKGGIAGYALVLLYEESKSKPYLDQALQNARVLVSNMRADDGTHAPWPFRVDYRTGAARGEVSGNMSYILRLFDKLAAMGYSEFQKPREALWTWIHDYQIPNANKDGMLWGEFFEDHHSEKNRTAWAPLNLARYLIEKKQKIDPDWQAHAQLLIDFVSTTFTSVHYGVAVCGEQDEDRDPWGGINSTYGAVLAMYSAATGSPEYKRIARQALTFTMYAIDDDGCPRDTLLDDHRGGWQEDAHTDKVHNIVDAITAFPEWAN